MPPFFTVIAVLFSIIFVTVIILIIATAIKTTKENNTPIKKFTISGKRYHLHSIKTNGRYYSNQITYELRNPEGDILGTFNSLNDILVFLNIDSFPETESIF